MWSGFRDVYEAYVACRKGKRSKPGAIRVKTQIVGPPCRWTATWPACLADLAHCAPHDSPAIARCSCASSSATATSASPLVHSLVPGCVGPTIWVEMRALDETHALVSRLAAGRYAPSRSACFVSSGAKPREVYAASFRDRVVHHLLVRELEPIFGRLFIHDSYACRPGKGTHAAVKRLGQFLRAATRNGRRRAHYLKLDVRAFFTSVDREALWQVVLRRTRGRGGPNMPAVLAVLRAVLFRDPTIDPILVCPAEELKRVPESRRLGSRGPGIGLPIGNLTSQFLANVFLNELDLFVKHVLKAPNRRVSLSSSAASAACFADLLRCAPHDSAAIARCSRRVLRTLGISAKSLADPLESACLEPTFWVKARWYIRYVDDMVLVHEDPATLRQWER